MVLRKYVSELVIRIFNVKVKFCYRDNGFEIKGGLFNWIF